MRLSTHICQAVTLDCLVQPLQAITIAAIATAAANIPLDSHCIDGIAGGDSALHVRVLIKQKLARTSQSPCARCSLKAAPLLALSAFSLQGSQQPAVQAILL